MNKLATILALMMLFISGSALASGTNPGPDPKQEADQTTRQNS